MILNLGNDRDLPIKVTRTSRLKTAAIKVIEGEIQVIVPQDLSAIRIESLVRSKTSWIRKRLQEQAARKPGKPKEYVSGEAFSYLGKNYRLKLLKGDDQGVKLRGGRFVVEISDSIKAHDKKRFVQKQIISWYGEHSLPRLRQKVERYAPLLGVSPRSINIRQYKARWGGCSAKGDITFNWRIIMAPHRIIDYVVVHELCHLKHHNHSPAFWKCVEQVLPDYAESRAWLKLNGDDIRA